MTDSPDKIQWHPAFCAAAGLELHENIDALELIPEYNLSKEPIRIDLLIIKDHKKSGKIKNEIGHIMRTYNVIEYKSPEDSLTIDDFYKTVGYACLYKGYGDAVDKIPVNELTASLFREAYPREMFLALERHGHEIGQVYPGIYYITNNLPFPVQVIVTKELKKETHSCLRVLSTNAEKDDVERFLKMSEGIKSSWGRNNIDSILQASARANFDLYKKIRRESVVCDVLRELFKDEIEEELKKAEDCGEANGEANAIAKMHKNGFTPNQIASALDKTIEEVNIILSSTQSTRKQYHK